MSAPWLRRWLPLAALLLPTTTNAQFISPAWNTCRGDTLSTWNCAHYYSGTVSVTSELKGPNNLHETYSLVATITAGKVVCHTKGSEVGEFSGPGMVAVQHDDTGNGGDYAIMIWCPESEDDRPTRHEQPNVHVQHQRAADYAVLSGKEEYEHPSADSVNGITGTESLTWNVRKN
jgi:hypothetical protein